MSEDSLKSPENTRTHRVIADYQVAYPDPLVICAGERLIVGEQDPEYPGWVWCTDGSGKGGWVPDDCIEPAGDIFKARYDYTATELAASAGEELTMIKEKSGWAWCTNERGQSGWLPVANLEKAHRG